jgi:stage III sporulation protein AB
MDNLARLGQILGDMDVDSQVERLDMVRELMDRQRELEREKCAKLVPLAKSMGFFMGVFLVIILV